MKLRHLVWLLLVFVVPGCINYQVQTPLPTHTVPPTGTSTLPAATAPTVTPTPAPAATTIQVDGDCGEYPGDAQVGPGIFGVVNNNSVYVCVADTDIGGDDPTVDVTLQSGAGEHAFSWRWDDSTGLLRRLDKAENNALFDSHLVYGETSLELRIGTGQRSTSGLPQGEPFDLTQMIIRAYNMALDGSTLVELEGQYPLALVDQNDPDTVVKADPVMQFDDGRSQLAELFEVPEGYEVRVVGDKPQFPGVWDIQPGGDDGFFLFQNLPEERVSYVSLDGQVICSVDIQDLGRNQDSPIFNIVSATGDYILLEVGPWTSMKMYADCTSEVLMQTIGLIPVVYVDEVGLISLEFESPNNIYLTSFPSREQEIIPTTAQTIYSQSFIVTPDNELIFWDFLTGLHKIDLDTRQDRVIYSPRGYHDSFSLAIIPTSNNIYFFEATGTLFELDLASGIRSVVSETTECIWHPEGFIVKSDGSTILGTDRATGGVYSYNINIDEVTFLQEPFNTSALDVADDGTVFAGYTGCQGSGYIKRISPDGSTTLFSEELPVQVRKLKTQGDLVFVLGVNGLGWGNLPSELTVLNQAGQIEYSVDLPQLSFDNLSVLQNGNALVCDQWRNRCVEAGQEGVIREFSVNFLGADQPMYFTNQSPDGSIYAYLGFNRGIVNGTPTVDRYIMEFDLESRTFIPLFQTQHTGSSGSYITLDLYSDSEGNPGLFFNIQPRPQQAYHLSPEGMSYILENADLSNPHSLESLLHRKINGMPVVEVIGSNLPIDTWGIGARMTEDGAYTVIASSLGFLQFYQRP